MRLIEKRISLLKQNVDTTNTVKDNKAAAKLLRSHLKEKNMETTFKMFDVATLVETLYIFSLAQKGEIFTKPQLQQTQDMSSKDIYRTSRLCKKQYII